MAEPSARATDPAERRALDLLRRRPRAEGELRRALAEGGFDDARIDATIARLVACGYVDDRSLALDYLVSRAERLGHAPARLLAELRARGVPEPVLEAAEREAREVHGIDAQSMVRREIDRRGAGKDADPRRNARVYQALLRAGYDAADVASALGVAPPDESEP
jgi:SOS response regulatory protein OraA/RecX